MAKDNRRRSRLRRVVQEEQGAGEQKIRLQKFEQHAFGLREDFEEPPYVNLKYYDSSFQCFSSWKPDELKQFSRFVQKLQGQRWADIYRSGAKRRGKVGLGYTKHDNPRVLPPHPALDALSPDITFFELRLSEKIRVHGFRVKAAFFLVWLDRDHEIYRMG